MTQAVAVQTAQLTTIFGTVAAQGFSALTPNNFKYFGFGGTRRSLRSHSFPDKIFADIGWVENSPCLTGTEYREYYAPENYD